MNSDRRRRHLDDEELSPLLSDDRIAYPVTDPEEIAAARQRYFEKYGRWPGDPMPEDERSI